MRKVMKLINPVTGLMECTVCKAKHYAQVNQTLRGNSIRALGNVKTDVNE